MARGELPGDHQVAPLHAWALAFACMGPRLCSVCPRPCSGYPLLRMNWPSPMLCMPSPVLCMPSPVLWVPLPGATAAWCYGCAVLPCFILILQFILTPCNPIPCYNPYLLPATVSVTLRVGTYDATVAVNHVSYVNHTNHRMPCMKITIQKIMKMTIKTTNHAYHCRNEGDRDCKRKCNPSRNST